MVSTITRVQITFQVSVCSSAATWLDFGGFSTQPRAHSPRSIQPSTGWWPKVKSWNRVSWIGAEPYLPFDWWMRVALTDPRWERWIRIDTCNVQTRCCHMGKSWMKCVMLLSHTSLMRESSIFCIKPNAMSPLPISTLKGKENLRRKVYCFKDKLLSLKSKSEGFVGSEEKAKNMNVFYLLF